MVLVQHILDDARRRLAIVDAQASICEAARMLSDADTPLVVVCDDAGRAVGVITRADIVRVFAGARAAAAELASTSVMSAPILSCSKDQTLQSLWDAMGCSALRCSPVLDGAGRPLGIVHARVVARALLDEIGNEESLLRDYVLGIGYQ